MTYHNYKRGLISKNVLYVALGITALLIVMTVIFAVIGGSGDISPSPTTGTTTNEPIAKINEAHNNRVVREKVLELTAKDIEKINSAHKRNF